MFIHSYCAWLVKHSTSRVMISAVQLSISEARETRSASGQEITTEKTPSWKLGRFYFAFLLGPSDTVLHCSDAHFCRSPVTDRLKSRKTLCSNPHQDLGAIKYSSCGLVSHCFCEYDAVDKPVAVFLPKSSLRAVQNTDLLTSASGLQGHHVLAEGSGHVYIE